MLVIQGFCRDTIVNYRHLGRGWGGKALFTKRIMQGPPGTTMEPEYLSYEDYCSFSTGLYSSGLSLHPVYGLRP